MLLRKLAIALTAGLAAVALTACGPNDNDEPEGSDPSETPSATHEPTDDPSVESSEETSEETETDGEQDGADGELTAPGSQVAIGDSATVKTEDGAIVKVTVTEIEEGTSSQLADLKINADANTLTPFFVKISAEVVSGNADNFDPAVEVTGLIGENQGADQLLSYADFEPCQNDGFDTGSQPGDTVDSCTIQIADKGSKVDGVMYAVSNTEYDRYDGQPVFWR